MDPHQSSLPDPAAVLPTEILRLEHFSEGPVVDTDGYLYISSPPGGYVLKGLDVLEGDVLKGDVLKGDVLEGDVLEAGGDFATWAEAPRANGHKILADGTHLLCHGDHVLRLDATGQVLGPAASGVVRGDAGAPDHEIRWPNDVTLDGQGGFYFTESLRHVGAVLHVAAGGTMRIVARDIDFANGLVLAADGHRLFVAESYANRILVVELAEPGVAAGAPNLFADLPRHPDPDAACVPDGIALDTEGRLWVAHYGMRALQVLGPDGCLLATYDSGIPLTSNLCFAAGALYVTGGIAMPGPGLVTRLDLDITGAPT